MRSALAVDGDAETALRLLDDAIGLAPVAAGFAAGGLGPEAAGAVTDVMFDAVTRDVARAAVPVLGALVLSGTSAEQVMRPGRAGGDLALGELVAQAG